MTELLALGVLAACVPPAVTGLYMYRRNLDPVACLAFGMIVTAPATFGVVFGACYLGGVR